MNIIVTKQYEDTITLKPIPNSLGMKISCNKRTQLPFNRYTEIETELKFTIPHSHLLIIEPNPGLSLRRLFIIERTITSRQNDEFIKLHIENRSSYTVFINKGDIIGFVYPILISPINFLQEQ